MCYWYLGCAGWHGTEYYEWFSDSSYGFARGPYGIFSFYGAYGSWAHEVLCGRGVAVVLSAVRAERVADELCDEA